MITVRSKEDFKYIANYYSGEWILIKDSATQGSLLKNIVVGPKASPLSMVVIYP